MKFIHAIIFTISIFFSTGAASETSESIELPSKWNPIELWDRLTKALEKIAYLEEEKAELEKSLKETTDTLKTVTPMLKWQTKKIKEQRSELSKMESTIADLENKNQNLNNELDRLSNQKAPIRDPRLTKFLSMYKLEAR